MAWKLSVSNTVLMKYEESFKANWHRFAAQVLRISRGKIMFLTSSMMGNEIFLFTPALIRFLFCHLLQRRRSLYDEIPKPLTKNTKKGWYCMWEVRAPLLRCKWQQEIVGQNMIKRPVQNSLLNSFCPPVRVQCVWFLWSNPYGLLGHVLSCNILLSFAI